MRKGVQAEDTAAEFLADLGYTVVTRRFKTRHGELDIVALDGDTLVIVEVKERRAPGWVPEEGLDRQKAASLSAATEEYLQKMGETDRIVRFDLVALDARGLRHHIDAFRPG